MHKHYTSVSSKILSRWTHKYLPNRISKYCHGREDFIPITLCNCNIKCEMVSKKYDHVVKFYINNYCYKNHTFQLVNDCSCDGICLEKPKNY